MSKIITIAGQNGGAGKSVTAVNLATAFALYERKTLLVDFDPKGSATRWAGPDGIEGALSITTVLTAKSLIRETVSHTQFNFLDIIPSDFDLFQAGLKLSKIKGNENILKLLLKEMKNEYDLILIDTPSSFEFLFISAVLAADELLVCMSPDTGCLHDYENLLKTVKYVKLVHDHTVNIAGLLFNRCDNKEKIDQLIKHNEIDGDIESRILKTVVPRDDTIEKSIRLNMQTSKALN